MQTFQYLFSINLFLFGLYSLFLCLLIFRFFKMKEMPRVFKEHPIVTKAEASTECRARYETLSNAEKETYEILAKNDMLRYKKEIQESLATAEDSVGGISNIGSISATPNNGNVGIASISVKSQSDGKGGEEDNTGIQNLASKNAPLATIGVDGMMMDAHAIPVASTDDAKPSPQSPKEEPKRKRGRPPDLSLEESPEKEPKRKRGRPRKNLRSADLMINSIAGESALSVGTGQKNGRLVRPGKDNITLPPLKVSFRSQSKRSGFPCRECPTQAVEEEEDDDDGIQDPGVSFGEAAADAAKRRKRDGNADTLLSELAFQDSTAQQLLEFETIQQRLDKKRQEKGDIWNYISATASTVSKQTNTVCDRCNTIMTYKGCRNKRCPRSHR